jgi:hypothetical protein
MKCSICEYVDDDDSVFTHVETIDKYKHFYVCSEACKKDYNDRKRRCSCGAVIKNSFDVFCGFCKAKTGYFI